MLESKEQVQIPALKQGKVKWWRSLPVRIWVSVLALLLLMSMAIQGAWYVAERERRADVERPGVFIDDDGSVQTGRLVPEVKREPGKPPVFFITFIAPDGSRQALQWEGANLTGIRALMRQRNVPFINLTMGLLMCAIAGLIAWGTTRRLTRLQHDIARWSAGDLARRADASGGDEAAALAQHFNRAASQIQQLVQEKDALLRAQKMMLANASHEMRAPMNRILSATALLPGGEEHARWHEEIRRSVEEMDGLTEEILDFSRLEAQQDDMARAVPEDMLSLVANECMQYDVALKDARGRSWLNPEPETAFGETVFAAADAGLEPVVQSFEVLGVRKLLHRAVSNLLRNARRYGGAEGVSVTLDTEGDDVVIHVDDSGPGVPEGEREDIFRPFYRTKSASESQGGWGLGLAMVRTIAQRHGGSAECSAAPSGGARFTIRLPLLGSAASPKPT